MARRTTRTAGTLGRPNEPAVLILTSLASGSKHGYALSKDIEDFAGVALGPGTLYGAITRLEDRGLIEAVGTEARRRPYRITATGQTALAEAVRAMRTLADTGAARLGLTDLVGGSGSPSTRPGWTA
jgi:DNA-binding PadR family transcriptional regulator